MKRLLFVIFSSLFIFNGVFFSFAAEENVVLNENVVVEADTYEEQVGRHVVDVLSDLQKGASKPNSKNVVDLSEDSYDFNVTSIGYRVYTNYWFTGTDTITVCVENWSKLSGSAPTNELTVELYSSGGLVGTYTMDMDYGSDAVDFTNLSSSMKYYVLFEVPTNGNRYAFDGYIY